MRVVRDNDVETAWGWRAFCRRVGRNIPFHECLAVADAERNPSSSRSGVGAMTMTISWRAAGVRRLERQFLANSLAAGAEAPADVVAAMLGVHAQAPSAAEVSVGVRAEGVTRAEVRAALVGAAVAGADARTAWDRASASRS